jgi:cysteine synthase A
MMAGLGAEVVLVDQLPGAQAGQVSGGDLALVEQRAQKIVRERGAFRADQFRLKGSMRAHYLHTAPEILSQSGGAVDAFVDFVGTGGSFAGCARAFREFNHAIRCYVLEPAGAAVLAGGVVTNPNHRIQGGGYAMELPLLDRADVDGYLTVTDEEAIHTARRLAKAEGIFAGFSSGANVAAALHLIQTTHQGQTIAVLLCDSGLKYLSTDLWQP